MKLETLEDVCEHLKVQLDTRPPRFEPWELAMMWGVHWRKSVHALVRCGELLWDSYGFHDEWRPKPEEIECLNRFNELKSRADEMLK